MNVHFLNLDRSADRLAEFRAVNSHLAEMTRIRAVDESLVDLDALAAQGIINGDILSMYPIGALCHVLSDIKLWNKSIDTRQPVTVADDDAIFNFQFDTCAAELIETLPADWDMVIWGCNFDTFQVFEMLPGVTPCVAQFDEEKSRSNIRTFQEMVIKPRAYRLLWQFGGPSYTVSPRGARRLLEIYFPLQPVHIPVPEIVQKYTRRPTWPNVGPDLTLNGLLPRLNVFACFPPLAISKNEKSKSTIQAGGSGTAPFRPRATAASPSPSPVPEDVAAFSKRGIELQKLNRREEALAEYEKALSLKPDDVTALSCRGNVLFDLGRFDAALANCDKLLSIRPNDAQALNMRGLVLELFKRPEEALASYDKAVAAAPGAIEALYNRANILADLSRFEEALGSYDQALAIAPDSAPVLNNRGLVLEELKRFDEAVASYEKALKSKPDYGAAANNRRLLLDEIERSRMAARAGKKG